MTSAMAPYTSSYELRTPYISVTEFINSPVAVDYNNLLPGGSTLSNEVALQETIGRASSWVDQFTCGAYGTLCATVETENARLWGSYRGTLISHCRYWPILEVRSFSYTTLAAGLASGNNIAASVDPSTSIVVYPQEFEVSQPGLVTWSPWATGGIQRRYEFTCEWVYVAGWPQTSLGASVAAGAASIEPTTVTGIYPGTMLTIYDVPNDEPITVASTYTPGDSIVPLTSELQYSHQTTATVTNLPPAIKQATIWITNAFIKQRGSGALEVTDMGATVHQQSGYNQNSGSDWDMAKMLLWPFRQQYMGY